MQMRPCLSSVSRRRANVATSPSADNPSGSQNPMGACTPSSVSKAALLVFVPRPRLFRLATARAEPTVATATKLAAAVSISTTGAGTDASGEVRYCVGPALCSFWRTPRGTTGVAVSDIVAKMIY
eukprot:CAMPEP_0172790286 /NCGR_PEP_ID=MMETSP1074-20121228/207887_1 /TAXON_ID=2916 /ORGANISM="Ceratium fusus, Strain PA161109" /LENGTH=124 /DNA_ID=CAMNT_0013627331 /DNA_START=41 /DNA_END=415 /DNA_ORIENTATION=+